MKKFFALSILAVVFVLVSPAFAAEEPPVTVTCSLTLVAQQINHIEVKAAVQGADTATLEWQNGPVGGISVGDGWQDFIDLDYNAIPDRAHQTLTLKVNGTTCATLPVTISEWVVETPGGNDPGTTTGIPAAALSMPVAPGSMANRCLQLNGWRDAELQNRYHFVVAYTGENPNFVGRVYFGDGDFNDPERLFDGTTASFYHDYAAKVLEAGVRVSVVPVFLGDFGDCLIVDINANVTDFLARNGGGSYVNLSE